MGTYLEPATPGELLSEEFPKPLGISQYRLAKEIGMPAQRVGQIVLGHRHIIADTDLRPCRFFGLTDDYWLRVQDLYDPEATRKNLGDELTRIIPWVAAACLQVREHPNVFASARLLEATAGLQHVLQAREKGGRAKESTRGRKASDRR